MSANVDIEHPLRPAVQRWGAILWPSFFAAGVACMVFFALVDPDDLREITWAELDLGREAGYTIGFFMFWLCTSASSLFTWLLLSEDDQTRFKLAPPKATAALPEHRAGSDPKQAG